MRKLPAGRDAGRNVKLGPGGIREIELIAQTLQVCYGSRIMSLRERSTLAALKTLLEHSLISAAEHELLTRAYVFLRDVENKLQMVHDTQTHSLPLADDELAACARLLGYESSEGSPSNDLNRTTAFTPTR